MNWIQRNGMHLSAPYRIVHNVRGLEAWVFGKKSGCLGREIKTLERAKELCEQHKAKEATHA